MAWKIDRQKALAAGWSDSEIDAWLSEKNSTVTPPTPSPTPIPQQGQVQGASASSPEKPKIAVNVEAAKAAGWTEPEIKDFLNKVNAPQALDTQTEITTPYEITQEFGVQSQYEPQSGGINYGRDYGTPPNTEINLPKGKYRVVSAYKDADPMGGNLNNWENSGYGNSVLVKNEDTGEYLRISHLSTINVNEGDVVSGEKIATTGSSGHVTGPHLDVEYYDKEGQINDVAKTPYKDLVIKRETTKINLDNTTTAGESASLTPEKTLIPKETSVPKTEQAPTQENTNQYAVGTPEELKPLFDKASKETGIPTHVLSSQTKAESNFDPKAQSAYASGISQFTPGTAAEMGINPLDTVQAIPAQAKYLKQNIDMFSGDLNKGLAAYNAGPGAVQEAGGIPNYPETIGYIDRINKFAQEATAAATLKKIEEEKKKKKPTTMFRNGLLPF